MLNEAVDVVLEVDAVGVAAVVDNDAAAERWVSGLERRGWSIFRGAVGRLGRVWRRFRNVGGWFKAGEAAVVAVVDAVVKDDVAVEQGGLVLERGGWRVSWG